MSHFSPCLAFARDGELAGLASRQGLSWRVKAMACLMPTSPMSAAFRVDG